MARLDVARTWRRIRYWASDIHWFAVLAGVIGLVVVLAFPSTAQSKAVVLVGCSIALALLALREE